MLGDAEPVRSGALQKQEVSAQSAAQPSAALPPQPREETPCAQAATLQGQLFCVLQGTKDEEVRQRQLVGFYRVMWGTDKVERGREGISVRAGYAKYQIFASAGHGTGNA
eukprot:3085811-Rhodomonas_salina.2